MSNNFMYKAVWFFVYSFFGLLQLIMDIVEAFKSPWFWFFKRKGLRKKQRKKHRNDKLERIYGTPEHFLVAQDDFAVDDIGEIIYVDWKERLVGRLKDNG